MEIWSVKSALLMPKSMIDDQYQLATNPETAPEMLQKLSQSHDRAIRQAVAGNPNVPIEVLWSLVVDFPNEIVANPLFLLITLENLNWIRDIPPDKLRQLLEQSSPPEIFIMESLNYDDSYDEYNIRGAAVNVIAKRTDTSTEWLEEIALTHGILYPAVVEHLLTQARSFRKFAQYGDYYFQRDLISFCFDFTRETGRLWPKHLDRKEIINIVVSELIVHAANDDVIIALLKESRLPQYSGQFRRLLPRRSIAFQS
jgi:hypothetical protein